MGQGTAHWRPWVLTYDQTCCQMLPTSLLQQRPPCYVVLRNRLAAQASGSTTHAELVCADVSNGVMNPWVCLSHPHCRRMRGSCFLSPYCERRLRLLKRSPWTPGGATRPRARRPRRKTYFLLNKAVNGCCQCRARSAFPGTPCCMSLSSLCDFGARGCAFV